jgi:hypothetical protein
MWRPEFEKKFLIALIMVKIITFGQKREQNVDICKLVKESFQLHQLVVVLQRSGLYEEI